MSIMSLKPFVLKEIVSEKIMNSLPDLIFIPRLKVAFLGPGMPTSYVFFSFGVSLKKGDHL
jgi:hypothetical protein